MMLYPLLIPICASLIIMLIPRRFTKLCRSLLALIAAINAILCFVMVIRQPHVVTELFRFDALSALILAGSAFFVAVVTAYSIGYFDDSFNWKSYSIFVSWAMACASGISISNDFVLLLIFWGFLGLTLFLMLNLEPKAAGAAKKTLILVGGTDILMVAGIVIVWAQRHTWMISGAPLAMNGTNITAFLLITSAVLAKAGAFPFHTWLPDATEQSPAPFSALIPASLDKLLGIYLLMRVATNIFEAGSTLMTATLLSIGAITILGAVMMALVQHDMKRLLGYHAVSQVGYMIIGIGSGNILAMAGGLFHMLNNAIYKSSLFLSAGAIEKQTGTTDLGRLGGLAKIMPFTFISALVASLSISGIPPFNGFFSKLLIYQGLLATYAQNHSLIVICALIAALFGSSLTLASFIKILHAAFLSLPRLKLDSIKEAPWVMICANMLLSLLCLAFGIGAMNFVMPYIIMPSLSGVPSLASPAGVLYPNLALMCIAASLVIGVVIYFLSSLKVRKDTAYLGGETVDETSYPTGLDFYRTIETAPLIGTIYKWAKQKYLDVYDVSAKALRSCAFVLSEMHAGVLNSYVLWFVAGLIALLLISL